MSKLSVMKLHEGRMRMIEVDSTYPEMNTQMFGQGKLIEVVRPLTFQEMNRVRRSRGLSPVVIIADEEGLYDRTYRINKIASILYGTIEHHQPIMGPAYLVCQGSEGELESLTGFDATDVVEMLSAFCSAKYLNTEVLAEPTA